MSEQDAVDVVSMGTENSTENRLMLSYSNHGNKETDGQDRIPDAPPIIRLPGCPMPTRTIELKSMAPGKMELVTSTERCKQIVAKLQREKVIAVAAEGINISREGPLTLLQIGTCSGLVFIFDVLENRDLFHKGRLKVLLESIETVKVMHDSSKISASLNYQFAVSLTQVFDTQVAHHVISEHKGRRLPSGLKLSEICLQYTDSVDKFYTYDWRTDSKVRWMAQIGNFWANRPLTSDMMEFASGDVIVLIPDVFNHQLEYLEDNGLRGKFQHVMTEWLQLDIDDVVREGRGKRLAREVQKILREMDQTYDDRVTLFNILDEDEMQALALVDYEDAAEISPKILKLKIAHVMEDIKDIELRLRMDAESWESRGNILDYLRYYSQLPSDELKDHAEAVLENAILLIREHIETKYNLETTPNMLSLVERDSLLTIPYTEFESNKYGTVITSLYWKFMQDDVHEMINQLRFFPNTFSLTEHEYIRLDYFTKNLKTVPEEVASLASGLLHAVRSYNAENGAYVVGSRRKSLSHSLTSR